MDASITLHGSGSKIAETQLPLISLLENVTHHSWADRCPTCGLYHSWLTSHTTSASCAGDSQTVPSPRRRRERHMVHLPHCPQSSELHRQTVIPHIDTSLQRETVYKGILLCMPVLTFNFFNLLNILKLIYLNIFRLFPEGLVLLLLYTFILPDIQNLKQPDSLLNATPTSYLMCCRMIQHEGAEV